MFLVVLKVFLIVVYVFLMFFLMFLSTRFVITAISYYRGRGCKWNIREDVDSLFQTIQNIKPQFFIFLGRYCMMSQFVLRNYRGSFWKHQICKNKMQENNIVFPLYSLQMGYTGVGRNSASKF